MRESIRSVCYLVIAVAFILALVMWIIGDPDRTVWLIRIISPLVVLVGVLVVYLTRPPSDLVPDYLSRIVDSFFDRGGFCFGFTTSVEAGVCLVNAHFQNRYAGRCRGRIALRPARGFFLNRPDFDAITFDIECEGAGFGVASVPLPVPAKFQGKPQKFEVGASVEYPEGKGRVLRFQPGMLLRSNSKFGNAFATGLTIAGALGGMIVLNSPASVTLNFPSDVAEAGAGRSEPVVKTLWKSGDPPLVE